MLSLTQMLHDKIQKHLKFSVRVRAHKKRVSGKQP